jgi:hypothetical protein
MITKHTCKNIKETPWKDKIKECCDKEDPDAPGVVIAVTTAG